MLLPVLTKDLYDQQCLLQVEKDEHYIKTIVALCATAEEIAKQNNAIDIYEEYWADLDDASNLNAEAATISTVAH